MGILDIFKKKDPAPTVNPVEFAVKPSGKPIRPKKVKRKVNFITQTALRCVICDVDLMREGRQISYTCSDLCRMMLRGGKKNRKMLKKLYNSKEDLWTERQKYQYLNRLKG